MSHTMKNQRYAGKYAPALKRLFKDIDITENICEMLDTLVKTTVQSRSRKHGKTIHFDVNSWINKNYDPHEQVLWLLDSRVPENNIRDCIKNVVDLDNRAESILKTIEITDEVRLAMQDMTCDKLDILAEQQSCKEMKDREILIALAGEERYRITGTKPIEQIHWLLRSGYEDRDLEHILSNAHEWLLKRGYSKGDLLALCSYTDELTHARPEDCNQTPDTDM